MSHGEQVPTRREVRERVARLVSEVLKIPQEQISDTATVDNELQMQSISFVELQVAIEEAYDIQIDPIRIVELNAFGAIVDYIHQAAAETGQ